MDEKCEACGDVIGTLCASCKGYAEAAGSIRTGVVGPNHALLVGQIIGVLSKHEQGFPAMKVRMAEADDSGNYQNFFFIDRPGSGRWRVEITPEEVAEP